MIKRLLLLLIVSFSVLSARVFSVKENLYYLEHKLTNEQYKVMMFTYKSAKCYDLQWTATAIVWQESLFGKYKINLADPSCGYFHQLLPEYVDKLGVRANSWNMSRACEQLLFFETSFKVFIDKFHEKEQQCAIKGYKGANKWRCAVIRYNGAGRTDYYRNIVNKIKALRIFFKRKEISI